MSSLLLFIAIDQLSLVNNMLNIILDSTFNGGCQIVCLITARKAQSYHNLPEEGKNKVKSILHIMDKFSVSIQA